MPAGLAPYERLRGRRAKLEQWEKVNVMNSLIYIGIGITIIGGIGILIAAFKQSMWWGLGCFFFTPLTLVFVVRHWPEAKNPFLLQLAGVAIGVASVMMR